MLRHLLPFVTTRNNARNIKTYAWGNADHGQLGLPEHKLQHERDTFGRLSRVPQEIEELRNEQVKDVSISSSHCGIMLEDGNKLLMCGYGLDGQLGLGDNENCSRLKEIKQLPKLKQISCGGRHTLVLSEDGLVFSFGLNKHGQLGLCERENANEKENEAQLLKSLVKDGIKINQISTGHDFSVALCDQNNLYSWGTSYYGALGHYSNSNSNTNHFLNFLVPNYNLADYDNHPKVIQFFKDKKITQVYCGRRHVVAIDGSNNSIYGWGNGRHFLIGNESEETTYEPVHTFGSLNGNSIKKMSFGNSHGLILLNNGLVYSMGENSHGCLGTGESKGLIDFTSVPVLIKGASPAIDIGAGWNFCCAVMKNGDVKTWGCSSAGALGMGDQTRDVLEPTSIGLKANRVFTSSASTSVIATTE